MDFDGVWASVWANKSWRSRIAIVNTNARKAQHVVVLEALVGCDVRWFERAIVVEHPCKPYSMVVANDHRLSQNIGNSIALTLPRILHVLAVV